MPIIKADLTRCEGYGNCTLPAPDIFGVDDSGLVTLLRAEISRDELPNAQSAIRSCPVAALSISES